MSYTESSGMQNLMRIESLVASKLQNILSKESDNVNHIYLYNAGELWVAFENSAYQLEQLLGDADATIVMRLKNRPFPLVLNTISDIKVRGLYKKGNPLQGFIKLPASPMDKETFQNWYRELVVEV